MPIRSAVGSIAAVMRPELSTTTTPRSCAACHPSYSVMPLASVHELQRLQRLVRSGLSRVSCPILVAHGAHDTTADPEDANAIIASVSSDVREQLVCELSGHVVPVDFDAARLAKHAGEFLSRFRKYG